MNVVRRDVLFERTFDEVGEWNADEAARSRGFSVGSGQRGSPRGVLFGDVVIAKWRNLLQRDKEALDGIVVTTDRRNGPVKVVIYTDASAEARAAIVEPMP